MPEPVPQLVLASASPRRRALLAQAGLECIVMPATVDETPHEDEPPAAYVRRLARAKAQWIAEDDVGAVVVGADTTVVVDGAMLGKPASEDQARHMLQSLSARSHEVMSAVAVCAHGACDDRITVTRVSFRPVEEAEVRAYLESGEWRDKAGGYAIQGRAAAFVQWIEGSYTGVVGLPMFETLALLAAVGVASGRHR